MYLNNPKRGFVFKKANQSFANKVIPATIQDLENSIPSTFSAASDCGDGDIFEGRTSDNLYLNYQTFNDPDSVDFNFQNKMQVCKLNNPGTLTYFDNAEKLPDNYEIDDSYVNRNKSKRIKLMNDLPNSQIKAKDTSNLVAVSRLPQKYRSVFSKFEYFNDVQSEVYEDVMETSDPIVISAPTGCGKTALFELAIICHLMKRMANSKMVYIAPIKALCSERYSDWMSKFSDHQLRKSCNAQKLFNRLKVLHLHGSIFYHVQFPAVFRVT